MITQRKLVLASVAIVLAAVIGGTVYATHQTTPATHPYPLAMTPLVTKPNISIAVLTSSTNTERAKAGVPPLTEDARLDQSAQAHCDDMVRLNEWGHYLSDSTTPQTFISKTIPDWHHSGENTTWGWETSESIMSHLMNSPEHKANILDATYTLVGYALCKAPSYPNIMVQQFAGF